VAGHACVVLGGVGVVARLFFSICVYVCRYLLYNAFYVPAYLYQQYICVPYNLYTAAAHLFSTSLLSPYHLRS